MRPAVPRAKLHELIASLPPCTIAMEACSGGHHWARVFAAHGHTARLIAPKFVAPYRMSGVRGKNDAADAAAICEAMQRPPMRFVPVKSIDQQARLMAHKRSDPISKWAAALRERAGWQKAVVALANKNARILWAVMTKGDAFDARHVSVKPGSPTPAAAST